jgi:hypothetical protein
MKNNYRWFCIIVVLLGMTIPGNAQKVSDKKEIAVFNLSYYDWNIPNAAWVPSMNRSERYSSIWEGSTW